MPKKICSLVPGESETDDIVRRWLAGRGIDASLVSGYSVFRHQGELPRIMLEMYFDDSPDALAEPEPGDVSRETSEPAHDGDAAQGRDIRTPRNEEGN